MNVYFLHGFFGRPEDWRGYGGIAVDLFDDEGLTPTDTMDAWAARFDARVAREADGPAMIVGYSMGARLALHAIEYRPERWRRAVLVSCHPGLVDETERAERRERDREWAGRFLELPWDQVRASWEGQAVFGGAPPPSPRDEESFSRQRLASALTAWSLGKQRDFRAHPPTVSTTWVAGERDAKFAAFADVIVPNAGHRVPWENPGEFKKILETL